MIPLVYKAARSMYAADSGVGGLTTLLTGGYFTQLAPTTAVPPFMVGSIQADGERDSFGGNGSVGFFAFNIYTPKTAAGGAALSIGTQDEPIISRLMTVFHNKSTTATFNGLTWTVSFKRSSGIGVPESDFAWHHAEVYQVTCFPTTV